MFGYGLRRCGVSGTSHLAYTMVKLKRREYEYVSDMVSMRGTIVSICLSATRG